MNPGALHTEPLNPEAGVQAAQLRDWLADVLIIAYDRKMTAARSVYTRQRYARHFPQQVTQEADLIGTVCGADFCECQKPYTLKVLVILKLALAKFPQKLAARLCVSL